MANERKIQLAKAFQPLLYEASRYKVYYGGRGGGKSYAVALALLTLGMQRNIRVLCTRELQTSISASVHQLLADIINAYGLQNNYTVLQTTIRGSNGTEFIFKGLKHNITEIKGMEGIDYVWCEESENISNRSWELLIPTIRKEGSEIWVVFNPRNPTDPTYERFVTNARDDSIIKKVSYRDNPWFPSVLDKERLALKESDYEAYLHIWEGEFDTRHTGSIYAKLLDKARADGRICPVPAKHGAPVVTAWDLGKKHTTAIWFAQVVGLQPRIIDFYEAGGEELDHYAEVVKSKPYKYEAHYLPHDAKHDRLGMVGSIQSQLKTMGIQSQILKMTSIRARIELARALIAEAWFDQDKCQDGIHALMQYHYEWVEDMGRFKDTPNQKHWSADASDAFGYLAQVLDRGVGVKKPVKPIPLMHTGGNSYMGV